MSMLLQKILKLAYDGRYIFLSTIFEKITFFIVFLLIARSYPGSYYGYIVTVFAIANIVYAFFELGFSVYFQRISASDRESLSENVSAAVIAQLLLLPLYMLANILILNTFTHAPADLIVVLPVWLGIYGLGFGTLFTSVLYGRGEYSRASLYLLLSRLGLIIVFVLMFMAGGLARKLVFPVFFPACLIQLALSLRYLGEKGLKIRIGPWNLKQAGRILRSSLPTGAAALLVLLYDRADVVLIGRYISFRAVAVYSIAYSLYKLSQVIAPVLLVPAFSRFSKAYARNGTILMTDLREISVSLSIMSILIAFYLIVFPEFLIRFTFGGEYLESVTYLKLLALAVPGLFLNNLTGVIANAVGREKYPLFTTFAGAVVNITINIIFLRYSGIMAAVAATIAAEYLVFAAQAAMLLRLNQKKKIIC